MCFIFPTVILPEYYGSKVVDENSYVDVLLLFCSHQSPNQKTSATSSVTTFCHFLLLKIVL